MDSDDPDDPVAISEDEPMPIALNSSAPEKTLLTEVENKGVALDPAGGGSKGDAVSSKAGDNEPERGSGGKDVVDSGGDDHAKTTAMQQSEPQTVQRVTRSTQQQKDTSGGNVSENSEPATTATKPVDKSADIACVTLDSDSDESANAARGNTQPSSERPNGGLKIPRRCLNPDCGSREALVPATSADLAYLRTVHGEGAKLPERVRQDGRRYKVCRTCRSIVEKYHQAMSDLLRDGRPLLEGAVRQKEDEVCLDSDGEDEKDVDEAEDDSSASDDSGASLLEVDSDVEAEILAAMAAVQFDDQLEKSIEWLQSKHADIDESFSKTERDLARLDKDVNYLYEDLYKERPPSKIWTSPRPRSSPNVLAHTRSSPKSSSPSPNRPRIEQSHQSRPLSSGTPPERRPSMLPMSCPKPTGERSDKVQSGSMSSLASPRCSVTSVPSGEAAVCVDPVFENIQRNATTSDGNPSEQFAKQGKCTTTAQSVIPKCNLGVGLSPASPPPASFAEWPATNSPSQEELGRIPVAEDDYLVMCCTVEEPVVSGVEQSTVETSLPQQGALPSENTPKTKRKRVSETVLAEESRPVKKRRVSKKRAASTSQSACTCVMCDPLAGWIPARSRASDDPSGRTDDMSETAETETSAQMPEVAEGKSSVENRDMGGADVTGGGVSTKKRQLQDDEGNEAIEISSEDSDSELDHRESDSRQRLYCVGQVNAANEQPVVERDETASDANMGDKVHGFQRGGSDAPDEEALDDAIRNPASLETLTYDSTSTATASPVETSPFVRDEVRREDVPEGRGVPDAVAAGASGLAFADIIHQTRARKCLWPEARSGADNSTIQLVPNSSHRSPHPTYTDSSTTNVATGMSAQSPTGVHKELDQHREHTTYETEENVESISGSRNSGISVTSDQISADSVKPIEPPVTNETSVGSVNLREPPVTNETSAGTVNRREPPVMNETNTVTAKPSETNEANACSAIPCEPPVTNETSAGSTMPSESAVTNVTCAGTVKPSEPLVTNEMSAGSAMPSKTPLTNEISFEFIMHRKADVPSDSSSNQAIACSIPSRQPSGSSVVPNQTTDGSVPACLNPQNGSIPSSQVTNPCPAVTENMEPVAHPHLKSLPGSRAGAASGPQSTTPVLASMLVSSPVTSAVSGCPSSAPALPLSTCVRLVPVMRDRQIARVYDGMGRVMPVAAVKSLRNAAFDKLGRLVPAHDLRGHLAPVFDACGNQIQLFDARGRPVVYGLCPPGRSGSYPVGRAHDVLAGASDQKGVARACGSSGTQPSRSSLAGLACAAPVVTALASAPTQSVPATVRPSGNLLLRDGFPTQYISRGPLPCGWLHSAVPRTGALASRPPQQNRAVTYVPWHHALRAVVRAPTASHCSPSMPAGCGSLRPNMPGVSSSWRPYVPGAWKPTQPPVPELSTSQRPSMPEASNPARPYVTGSPPRLMIPPYVPVWLPGISHPVMVVPQTDVNGRHQPGAVPTAANRSRTVLARPTLLSTMGTCNRGVMSQPNLPGANTQASPSTVSSTSSRERSSRGGRVDVRSDEILDTEGVLTAVSVDDLSRRSSLPESSIPTASASPSQKLISKLAEPDKALEPIPAAVGGAGDTPNLVAGSIKVAAWAREPGAMALFGGLGDSPSEAGDPVPGQPLQSYSQQQVGGSVKFPAATGVHRNANIPANWCNFTDANAAKTATESWTSSTDKGGPSKTPMDATPCPWSSTQADTPAYKTYATKTTVAGAKYDIPARREDTETSDVQVLHPTESFNQQSSMPANRSVPSSLSSARDVTYNPRELWPLSLPEKRRILFPIVPRPEGSDPNITPSPGGASRRPPEAREAGCESNLPRYRDLPLVAVAVPPPGRWHAPHVPPLQVTTETSPAPCLPPIRRWTKPALGGDRLVEEVDWQPGPDAILQSRYPHGRTSLVPPLQPQPTPREAPLRPQPTPRNTPLGPQLVPREAPLQPQPRPCPGTSAAEMAAVPDADVTCNTPVSASVETAAPDADAAVSSAVNEAPVSVTGSQATAQSLIIETPHSCRLATDCDKTGERTVTEGSSESSSAEKTEYSSDAARSGANATNSAPSSVPKPMVRVMTPSTQVSTVSGPGRSRARIGRRQRALWQLGACVKVQLHRLAATELSSLQVVTSAVSQSHPMTRRSAAKDLTMSASVCSVVGEDGKTDEKSGQIKSGKRDEETTGRDSEVTGSDAKEADSMSVGEKLRERIAEAFRARMQQSQGIVSSTSTSQLTDSVSQMEASRPTSSTVETMCSTSASAKMTGGVGLNNPFTDPSVLIVPYSGGTSHSTGLTSGAGSASIQLTIMTPQSKNSVSQGQPINQPSSSAILQTGPSVSQSANAASPAVGGTSECVATKLRHKFKSSFAAPSTIPAALPAAETSQSALGASLTSSPALQLTTTVSESFLTTCQSTNSASGQVVQTQAVTASVAEDSNPSRIPLPALAIVHLPAHPASIPPVMQHSSSETTAVGPRAVGLCEDPMIDLCDSPPDGPHNTSQPPVSSPQLIIIGDATPPRATSSDEEGGAVVWKTRWELVEADRQRWCRPRRSFTASVPPPPTSDRRLGLSPPSAAEERASRSDTVDQHPIQSMPPVDIYHTHSQRTIRFPDGRVYDLDPAWTAHNQPGDPRVMPPPPPQHGSRPPPLQPKPGVTVRPRAPPGAISAGRPARPRPPADKPAVDVVISDVVHVGQNASPSDLPPLGSIARPAVKPGDIVFAMHSDQLSPWFRARVRDVTIRLGVTRYRAKFETPRAVHKNRILEGHELAYMEQSAVRLHVGVRVVAAYRENDNQTPTFYSGTVAEAPKNMNGYRYLVFFDDGYAAYVRHNELKLIVSPSKNAAEDVHPDCREFVAKYLAQFPERPMVKLQPGQVVKTELAGRWMPARVQAVDASLVKMVFESERPVNSEWIYRGSSRLAPMYAELVPTQPRKLGTGARRNIQNAVNVGKKNRVYVEYTRHSERDESGTEDDPSAVGKGPRPVARAVARKSTATATMHAEPEPDPTDRLISPISPMEGDGQITEIANKPRVIPRRLQPHTCSRACVRNFNVDMDQMKGDNPLIMPMKSGWIREIVRHRTSKRTVLYRAPCGRRLRSMVEVFRYLLLTGCQLEIDCFCFDFWVHCFTEFVPARKFCSIKDISYSKENVPVSCVNSLDRDYPDYVEYSTRRLPTSDVHLNLDTDFLTCCNCTDDCQDKEKCSCWQSTVQGTEFGPTGQRDNDAGYHFRRLINGNVITGIYECNDRCRCRRSCLNRVVQHPLRLRLQVFKTLRRGWGIRCLDDIPKGGFICVYAGQLLTESGANEDGKNYGDEYLAELDYIEVLERLKEGYESDVVDEESEDEKGDDEKSDEEGSNGTDAEAAGDADSDSGAGRRGRTQDDDFVPTGGRTKDTSGRDVRRSNRARQQKVDADKEKEKETKKKSVTKTVETKKTISPEKPPSPNKDKSGRGATNRLSLPDENYKSVREQFGTDEYCYIMDAKNIGNLGRYLNHCCSPNVFVQNVFVDTHDLRFPWVAFFALSYIRAGTELTWDYNYEVGSVPGKVMYCHCGSQECRGRLL